MSAINDGGPAYPKPDTYYPPNQDVWKGCDGMTLRDWFAGQALAGILAQPGMTVDISGVLMGIERARCAYAFADAMIRARGEA